MIEAHQFIERARQHGFSLYAGVPCSYLKPFINFVIDAGQLRYVGAANEGDAVAVAAGAELGGQRAVAMFQNSGLGNAVSPLTSLTHTFRIPVLLIPTFRGEPGGATDEPQHELMGAITREMLELMDIPWRYFPTEASDIDSALDEACEHMDQHRRPFALVMRKGSVSPTPLESHPTSRAPTPRQVERAVASVHRRDVLAAIQSAVGEADVVIATTGYTGRELYVCGDRPNQLYVVGSMGCASSLGLGLALARPDRRVVVLDGDGAALMRLGALATIGHEQPPNLVHVVLDNGMHESTGGQATVSPSIDFCAVASATGYPSVASIGAPDDVAAHVADRTPGLRLLHVPILPGVPDDLPRPRIRPPEVAERLREHLA